MFNMTLATIVEEDAVDIYYEIICDFSEKEKDEIPFDTFLAIGMELLNM